MEPTLSDRCSNSSCGHRLGLHYVTLDESKAGCSHSTTDHDIYGGNTSRCSCSGFSVIYQPSRHISRSAEAYYQK